MRSFMNKTEFFRRIWFSYMLIFFLPIAAICILLFRETISANQREHTTASLDSAVMASNRIDDSFSQMNSFAQKLMNTGWIKKVYSNSEIMGQYLNHIRRLEISDELSVYKSSMVIVNRLAILLPQKDTSISEYSWGDIEYFLRGIDISKDTYTDISEQLSELKYFDVFSCDSKSLDKKNLVLLQNIDPKISNPRASLFFFIEKSGIDMALAQLGQDTLMSFSILSSTGEELYSYNTTVEASGDGEAFETSATCYGLTYKAVYVPLSTPISFSDCVLIAAITLLLILFGLLLSYWFTCLTYKPIRRMMMKVAPEAGSAINEFEAVEKRLSVLMQEKRELSKSLEVYNEMTRINRIRELMRGAFDQERLRVIEKEEPIFGESKYFSLNIICLKGYKQNGKADKGFDLFLAIKSCLLDSSLPFELIRQNDTTIVALFHSPAASVLKSDEEDSDTVIWKLLRQYMDKNYNCDISIYKGGWQSGLLGISKSYQNAKSAQEEARLRERVDIYSRGWQDEERYYFPTDWELQLVNQLKIGDISMSKQILCELREENVSRELTQENNIKVTMLVFETLLRVMNELGMNTAKAVSIFDATAIDKNASNLWDSLFEVAELLCSRGVEETSGSVGEQLVEYVQEHYSDYDISLKTLGEMFSMSVSAISRSFKAAMKINFYDYLCRIRMEKAKELLINENISLSEIATMVGYDNPVSFRRAFVRYTGITPTEFKQSAGTQKHK